jgi:hypothetical protein
VVWNPARINPGPMRSGYTSARVPAVTLTPEDCLSAEPAGPPFCPATPGASPTGTPDASSPLA